MASITSRDVSTVFSVAFNVVTTGAGVPAGARTKSRGEASKPGSVSASAGHST
jgi:hypothetical protein